MIIAATTPVAPHLWSPPTWLWWATIGGVVLLIAFDFLITRKPHEVSMREATAWSVFYIALPLLFAVGLWVKVDSEIGMQFLTGYLVEKTLSVDNLFVFMTLLSAFAVPTILAQRVLLVGIAGALVFRGIFIALGAAILHNFSWAFLLFGFILLWTAWKMIKSINDGDDDHDLDVGEMRVVKLIRRFFPVSDEYDGTRLTTKVTQNGTLVKALTPLAVVMAAVMATDVIFALDSIPAVFGITDEPYLVFATNAFALLGLRALYFVLAGALASLFYLSHALAATLLLIGFKLILHWAHGIWPGVPTIPTLGSLLMVIGIFTVAIIASRIKGSDVEEPAAGEEG